MKKIILFLMILTAVAFSQQLNYTFGYNTAGTALTGSFTNLDSTGTTSYTMVFKLDDFYPFALNPLVLDVQAKLDSTDAAYGSSDYFLIGTWWYHVDADAATDSTNFDIDVYTGVYGDANRTVAGIKWDATAVKSVDIVTADDITGGAPIYAEVQGKVFPPHVIKIVIDVDPTAAEVSAGLDVYYEFVYPALLQQYMDYKPKNYE